jgi:hypothetical protein
VEKYGRARQATDGNVTRRMRIAFCITKANNTFRICNTHCFNSNNGYANAPHFYVIRTPPVLFNNKVDKMFLYLIKHHNINT